MSAVSPIGESMSESSMRSTRPAGPSAGVDALLAAPIPVSHVDLIECPPVAALSTMMPGGGPQTSVVWCDFEAGMVQINTMRGFQKERNMRRNPLVTILCFDPKRPLRYLEVRGRVSEMTEDGAAEHLDALASKYAGEPVAYFGDVVAAELAAAEVPILCRILPTRVVARDWEEKGHTR